MRAPGQLKETYARWPVLLTATLAAAVALGVYWGYRFVGPMLVG